MRGAKDKQLENQAGIKLNIWVRREAKDKQGSVEVRDYWYRTYTYRYYGYNDTTEIVIELTIIFL